MILFKTVRCHGNSWKFRISKFFGSVVEKLNFAQFIPGEKFWLQVTELKNSVCFFKDCRFAYMFFMHVGLSQKKFQFAQANFR